MDNMENITNNIKIVDNDLEKLKIHFPQYFDKDGNFQLEKFKNNLSEQEVNFSTESYGLEWLGKSYARLLASDAATTLLKPDNVHNQQAANKDSQNLLIKGDNLEVLKHLVHAYREQVKMIYIDPPYNTGSDGFVYQDDRKFSVSQLQQLAGIDAEKAKRILEFTQSKSNSHSAWLTFMYPRLYIARQLLKDDGVIFVSIDDNEVAQLRLLMDEVFGEDNFLATFLWKKKSTTSNVDGAEVSSLTDYQICFKKSNLSQIKQRVKLKEDRSYPHLDEIGNYRITVIEKKDSGGYKRDTMKFEILGCKPRIGKRWQIGEDTARELENLGRFYYDGEKIQLKIYDFEDKDTFSAQPNLLDFCGTSDNASKYVNECLFNISELFDTPKPIELIKYLSGMALGNNDTILDFFAGSGTTGDAVMQLNSEDGGKRKYILVQLPEPIDAKKNKTAYDFIKNDLQVEIPTIFEITKERLKRAANKIKTEKPEYGGDLGFKVFETIPIWDEYNFEADQLNEQQALFDTNKLGEEDIQALLTTWKTYDGVALTAEVEHVDLAGYTAYYVRDKLYLMNDGFSTEALKVLLEKIDSDKNFKPVSIIAFGYHFESKSLREIAENIKSYVNKKKCDIDFITRY